VVVCHFSLNFFRFCHAQLTRIPTTTFITRSLKYSTFGDLIILGDFNISIRDLMVPSP
jgi:hypothetical protein